MPIVAIGLIAAVVLGGGTSLVASQALPGDMLYGVKLGVNENIEGAFALSDEARADWNIKAAERRLNEAAQVAAKGELSADAKADLEANFDDHVENVAAAISSLEARGNVSAAADIAVRLTGVLVKQGTAIASVQAETINRGDNVSSASLISLTSKVQSTLTAAAMIATRASAEAAPTSTNNNSADINAEVNVNGNVNVGL